MSHGYMLSRFRARWWALCTLATIVAIAGCQPADLSRSSSRGGDSAADQTDAAKGNSGPGQPASASARADDSWDAAYMAGAKVGYVHRKVTSVEEDGRSLLKIDSATQITLSRAGQTNTQEIRLTSLETVGGELIRFTAQSALGPTPTVTTGQVAGGQLLIDAENSGKHQTSVLDWPAGATGFDGADESLQRKPMRPGERRELKTLLPVFYQLMDVELIAEDFETVRLLDRSQKLLRIKTVMRPAGEGGNAAQGGEIESISWTDADGQVLKTRTDAMQQESYRTTAEIAQAEPGEVQFDLVTDALVKPDRPIEHPHSTRRVRYRLELKRGDPAKVFASCPTQSVKSLGPHAAEVTVRALRPGSTDEAGEASRPEDRQPTDDDRLPNSLIQSDDPRVVAMAKDAAGTLTEPLEVALALEKYVSRAITKKDFSQALASAADVAESRAGDCTEHAVLLAALARANGLPARVAIGLVYVEHVQGFGYHMWTEVYLDGHWLPLDATLGRGGIGAAHIKLTDSNMKGASAYSAFLPVSMVMRQLKIEVLEAE